MLHPWKFRCICVRWDRFGTVLLTSSLPPALECPQPLSVSLCRFARCVQLVASNERPCSSGGADFSVPIQQQVVGFPVARSRCAVRHGLLLLDLHLFLQVRPLYLRWLVAMGRLLDHFRVFRWRFFPAPRCCLVKALFGVGVKSRC